MKKILHLTSLITMLVMFFSIGVSAQVYADFDGSGVFKFKSNFKHGHHMVYTTSDPSALMEAFPDGTDDKTSEFKVVPNSANAGWYNIMTTDDKYFVISGTKTDGTAAQYDTRLKSVDDGGKENGEALFRFKADELVNTTAAVEGTWNIERKLDNQFINVKSGNVEDSKAFDLGKGYPNGQDKYRWIILRDGGQYMDVAEIERLTNDVYPVGGVSGMFNLKEQSAWTVYSISGRVAAKGQGTVIDLTSSPNGIYIVRAGQLTKKISF